MRLKSIPSALLIAIFLVSCSPTIENITPTATAIPISTFTSVPPTLTNTAILQAKTNTPQPTAAPTATVTATPGLARQVGLPDSLLAQFPITQQPEKYWTLFGNPDETEFKPDFNKQVGDILFISVTAFRYINAQGKPDFVYVPGLSLNVKKKTCILDGLSTKETKCAEWLETGGASFKPDDLSRFNNYLSRTYFPSRNQVAEVKFAYPSNLTSQAASKGFFDAATTVAYPNQLLKKFAETGDSSLLPDRLLIPFFLEASYQYSIQVATSTPIPAIDLPANMPIGQVQQKDISQVDYIANETFPLRRDIFLGTGIFHCLSGKTNYESIWVTKTILITGTLNCYYTKGIVKFPLGVYDFEQNRAVFWGLFPIEDITNLDYMAVRAENRFIHFIKDYQFANRTNKLVNLPIVMNLGTPNAKNLTVVDTKNFEPYLNAFYADPARVKEVNDFIETGVSPSDGLIFPLDMGVGIIK